MIIRTRTVRVSRQEWGRVLDPVAVQETQLDVFRELRDAGISSVGSVRFIWEVRERGTRSQAGIRRHHNPGAEIPPGTVEVSCIGTWDDPEWVA